MEKKSHLADVLRWSSETEVELAEVVASGLGVAGPVLMAAVLGHLPFGLVASVGGLMAGGAGVGRGARAQLQDLGVVLLPAILAAVAASLVTGYSRATDGLMVGLAAAAGAIGGYSRSLVAATTRFVLFLIITANIGSAIVSNRVALLTLILLGMAWAAGMALLLGGLVRVVRGRDASLDEVSPAAPTTAQKFTRWKRSLAHLSGWQYPLRLTFCLGIAVGLQWFWPDHHLHWVALTVAILLQRQVEPLPVKTTQRAIGTILGVSLASLLLAQDPPSWMLAVGIGLLAGVRPLLRARSYLAYSVVMTPLIVLIMDAGQPLAAGVLIDRLVATFIGAGLVITANWIAGKAHIAAA